MSACTKNETEFKSVKITKLTLNETSKVIKLGDAPTSLKITTTPENLTEIGVWSSTNDNIVSVDQKGLVTAVGLGNAKLTYTVSEKLFTNCQIRVLPEGGEDNGIKLSKRRIEIPNNTCYKLLATISPEEVSDKTIIWESTNENVAMIDDNGEITALSEGITTITAETANRYRAKCIVKVVKGALEIPKEIIGTWTGIRMELVSQSDGKIYLENDVKNILSGVSDKDQWLEDVRTSYSYTAKEDGTLVMHFHDGEEPKEINGKITDASKPNEFKANFTLNEEESKEYSDFEKQTLTLEKKFVIIQTPFGSGFDLKVYYKVSK